MDRLQEGQYDEKSSCWVRVSQDWAGTAFGSMALPRIGQEVIVEFLEGDPDQPIITGRSHDAVNVPPYKLPEHKTRMTIKSKTHKGTGFNELRFEDKKGEEEVFIQAEKDYRRIVKNNEEVDIKNDLKITPNGIELSSLNIDVDSSDLTLVEGGLVKINSGVSISGKGSTDVSDVKAAPDAEEFDGFGSNDTLERVLAEKNAESVFKDVEPVQVAGLGKGLVGAIAADVVVKTAIYSDKILKVLGKKIPKLTPKNVPCFNKNKKGSPEEYDKQLKDQQNGLNELTAEEYLKGRDAYSSVKRKSTSGARDKFKEGLTDGYEKGGMSEIEAFQIAEKKMKTLHALHNPDLIAGGKDKVTTFGDKSVNQSIGSQWKTRLDDLDKAAEKAQKEGKGKSKMNAVLTRCK